MRPKRFEYQVPAIRVAVYSARDTKSRWISNATDVRRRWKQINRPSTHSLPPPRYFQYVVGPEHYFVSFVRPRDDVTTIRRDQTAAASNEQFPPTVSTRDRRNDSRRIFFPPT